MNANLFTKKIEMSKSEAKEAGKLNSDKFHELRQFMVMYPNFEIEIKAPAKKKVEFKGLDYKYMRSYIQKHDASKMETFEILIAQAKKDGTEGAEHLEAAGYQEVKKWFLSAFPAIKQNKETHNQKVQAILAAVA